jgi:hypothetical protein
MTATKRRTRCNMRNHYLTRVKVLFLDVNSTISGTFLTTGNKSSGDFTVVDTSTKMTTHVLCCNHSCIVPAIRERMPKHYADTTRKHVFSNRFGDRFSSKSVANSINNLFSNQLKSVAKTLVADL